MRPRRRWGLRWSRGDRRDVKEVSYAELMRLQHLARGTPGVSAIGRPTWTSSRSAEIRRILLVSFVPKSQGFHRCHVVVVVGADTWWVFTLDVPLSELDALPDLSRKATFELIRTLVERTRPLPLSVEHGADEWEEPTSLEDLFLSMQSTDSSGVASTEGEVRPVEHRIDLDVAASLVERRGGAWQAWGWTVGPLTWADGQTTAHPVTPDRAAVRGDYSLGVHIVHGGREGEVVLYAGGWCDVQYWSGRIDDPIMEETHGGEDPLDLAAFDRLLGLVETLFRR